MPPSIDDTLFSPSKLKPPTKPSLDFTADLLGEVADKLGESEVSSNETKRRSSFRLKSAQVVSSNIVTTTSTKSATNIPKPIVVKKAPISSIAKPPIKHVNAASNLVATSTLKIGARSGQSNVGTKNPVVVASQNIGISKRKRPAWDTKVQLYFFLVFKY